jgi:hypothetical protein
MGTEWKYRIGWHSQLLQGGGGGSGNRAPKDAVVFVTMNLKDGGGNKDVDITAKDDQIVVRMWTNSDSSSDIVTAQHPLALFVSVTARGGVVSVTGALVTVTVQVRMTMAAENASSAAAVLVTTLPPLRLLDNGNADPDMLAGDGVYSRYMTRYPGVGRYTFMVTAIMKRGDDMHVKEEDEESKFYFPAVNQSDIGPPHIRTTCCGSSVPVFGEHLPAVMRKPFRRVVEGSAINLLAVPAAGERDRMPPSRIGDLLVRVQAETGSLLAAWTAPGNNFDEGTVSGYRCFFLSNILDYTLKWVALYRYFL